MSESFESRRTRTRHAIVEDPRTRRWLLLIAVVAAAIVVAEAVISGGYDGIAALVGVVLGVVLGWMACALEWIYSKRWHFWVVAGPAIAVWIANVIVGLLVLYPMWVFGLLFFFPIAFAGYIFLYGMLQR